MSARVLVTGASGFVGRAVTRRLLLEGIAVRGVVRTPDAAIPEGAERALVPDIGATTDWGRALEDVDVVIHLAARVHVMRETSADPLALFRAVNTAGTLNLARQAAQAGVRRLVFMSTVKVHGEAGRFRESDPPAPADSYGRSKLEAETGLRAIAADTGLEVVILRPPLVYGPGVRANFASLMRAIERGIPLPLGAADNRRSLIALDNLADVVTVASRHPAAANETFLVSDDDDLSTPELVRRLASALGVRPRLFPVPPALLAAGAAMLGKRDVADRLLGSLTVDCTRAKHLLGWTPPVSVDEGLRRAVASLR